MLKVKVCGLRHPDNLRNIAALKPEMVGFIFYPRSPRAVAISPGLSAALSEIPPSIQRVGVFVDAAPGDVALRAAEFGLSMVQLHGRETPSYAELLRSELPELKVIRAFQVDPQFDFSAVASYSASSDLFLFDAGQGSGRTFQWELLKGYSGNTPFLLAGGLTNRLLPKLRQFKEQFPLCCGFDLNSGFERSPGLKSEPAVRKFIEEVRRWDSE